MSYRQHKTGFKKSLWEQEEFKLDSYKEEYKQAKYSRSSPSMAHTIYMGPPRWTDRVTQFYSYNKAIGVDGGYRRNQMPGKCLDNGCEDGARGCSYGKVERKDGHMIFVFGATDVGHEKTVIVHEQKIRVFGDSDNHDYSNYSDSESDTDSD